jgi:chromosome segregation ATPase
MDQESEFERLERYVSKLLAQYDRLLEENSTLVKTIEQKDEEIHELRNQINSADTERGDISIRIKALIDQIEEWESTISNTESVPVQAEVSKEEQPEEVEAVDTVEEEADQEKKLQQNLFNVQPRSS